MPPSTQIRMPSTPNPPKALDQRRPSPEEATDCYWARLSSLNETHIIDSNIGAGPQVVMIQPSDRAFLTHSCQPWQKAD